MTESPFRHRPERCHAPMIMNKQRHTDSSASRADAAALAETRIEKLIAHLPRWMGNGVRWLRRPAARWVRIPVALLLIVGGVFAFLPILGLWMLPLSLVLLAEDIPFLKRLVARLINWLAQRRPRWFQ